MADQNFLGPYLRKSLDGKVGGPNLPTMEEGDVAVKLFEEFTIFLRFALIPAARVRAAGGREPVYVDAGYGLEFGFARLSRSRHRDLVTPFDKLASMVARDV